jgi:PAS domain S-box-containing protein
MDQMPTRGHAAGTARTDRKPSLTGAALLCLLTYAIAAGLTIALARVIMRHPANEYAAMVILAAGMAMAALLAVCVWHVAASRARATSPRNEARMLGIIRSSMEAIITIDDAQNIVFFNPAAERIFGVTAAEAVGSPLSGFVPARFRAAHAAHVTRFGATGISETRMGEQRVLLGLRANGEEFPLEASISQIHEDAGKLYTVMLRDVTERVKAENALKQSREELRQLSANLQNVREEEKHRIARELHDDLGQQLAALKMNLSTLEQTLFDGGGTTAVGEGGIVDQLRGMRREIDSTVASLRRIAADLRPVMLDDLGLAAAIDWLANDFTNRHGIDVVRRIEPAYTVCSRQSATALFRIVQEALNNVARHAEATVVELTLDTNGPHCHLRIADNGRGMSHVRAGNSHDKPFGLVSVRERAHRLGGSVQIDTAESEGFAITVTFPLQAMQQEDIDHDQGAAG